MFSADFPVIDADQFAPASRLSFLPDRTICAAMTYWFDAHPNASQTPGDPRHV
jgi:hypothetical protein